MTNERREKRKTRRRRRRFLRFIFYLIIAAVVLYLATLAVSIFGGGDIPGKLREYEFIDSPAKYVEESFNINISEPESGVSQIEITVREDKIYYNESEISVGELQTVITENEAEKAVLIDDSAKRVTYSAVYDELKRLGIIVEEK